MGVCVNQADQIILYINQIKWTPEICIDLIDPMYGQTS